LCDAPTGRGGTWNQDGVILFAPTNNGGLSRVSAAGGIPVVVTKATDGTHRNPSFLPDGRRFLMTASGSENGIYLGSLDE
jgi:serine/threonine-protein kinase